MDVAHIDCGSDGGAHLAAVIDCHDRELVGYEFARRGARQGGRGPWALRPRLQVRAATQPRRGMASRPLSVCTEAQSPRLGRLLLD
jgi:hypothetical protein